MKYARLMRGAVAVAASSALLLAGCSAKNDQKQAADGGAASESLDVFATTGYLADAVKNIAPDANITTMVGPGGDPHTYQPTTKDLETMQAADLTVWTGLHMEAQMLDQLEGLGDKQIAVGEMLPAENLLDWPETDDKGNPLHDPHIWNSPDNWILVTGYIADKLAEVDPANAETYKTNAKKYQDEIATAKADAEKAFEALSTRVLVTGHDAFNYLGATFDLEIHATDFVSSEAQLSAAEIDALAKMVAEKKVPVIFQDNLANPQAIQHLQEAVKKAGWEVQISDKELFADSLGAEEGVDTYLGVFKHNVDAIVEALGGK